MSSNQTPADATRIGRASGAKALELQELYDFDAAARTLIDAISPYESRVHHAHVLMLAGCGALRKEEAVTILKGLGVVDARASVDVSLRTYLPYEAELRRVVGAVGSKMHIGRSRNDLANTVRRMFLREQLNRTVEAVIELSDSVITKAAEHVDTVTVVYTQRKEAQPITLGHYLMAIAESLCKSISRYEQLYVRLNQCPLGSAATAGTGWPLNRELVASLLGFDSLVVNTIEGVAGWDHIAEFAAFNAIYMSGLSRLASEIQLWSTDEYRMAELDASFAGTSSIMPQKKNADSLERTRQAAAASMGPLVAILTSLNAVEYQYSAARVDLEPRTIDAMIAATHTMTGVVRTLQPDKAQMLRYAAENFSTMTDLADALVREADIDYRAAHEIVASVVEEALAHRKTANRIDLEMIQRAAQTHVGRTLDISNETIHDALDPVLNVQRRNGIGGPAPIAVKAEIDRVRSDLREAHDRLERRQSRLAAANETLDRLVTDLVSEQRS
ncbi:argininosuccinate lyase [Paraburkholderia caledonica]|uniref:Argininosuccinate lyase n=1 Tax=Paraburkholderia caledonica TaxID=134536 RepID=A0AB73IMU2_9BURK|nr:argininosuccinate lyase [Paraburkholderia caledonica]